MTVNLEYYVVFGKLDSSERIPWEYELNEEEEAAYLEAKEREVPFEDYPILCNVLENASQEIEEAELEMMIENKDEYMMECMGLAHVSPYEINHLVAQRDEHTLEFFHLEGCTEEELNAWDAKKLPEDQLPLIKDFEENFEPYNPFEGWTLVVQFEENW